MAHVKCERNMKPTEEQQAILDSTGRVLLINARAGTGKTTTLQMIASANPNLKILYLVFNRKAKDEAEGKFPNNVEIRTVHSLAFSGNVGRWKDQVGTFTITDVLPAFKGQKNSQQLAALGYDFLQFFMNSAFPRVEPAMEEFQTEHIGHVSDALKGVVKSNEDRIVQASRDILGQWYRQEKACPHDFYLKLFHREGGFHTSLKRFGMVLVDEGQDLSPIMLDALENYEKRIIIVGDTHQQIYSFRYAIDAMKRFPFDDKRDLTMSFRFGKKIADLASMFIREAKEARDFTIKGNPEKLSSVTLYNSIPKPKNGKRCAILSRTNLALFEKALGLRLRGIPFSLEGNISSILYRILDVYWLSINENDRIRDPFIQSFDSLNSIEKYAQDLDDFQLSSVVKIVKEHASSLPEAVFDVMKISKDAASNKSGPGIILSTVHGAKGQEYDQVYVDPDIPASLSILETLSTDNFGDEANIAYVAFTRAIGKLYLPLEFKDILTKQWQATMKQVEVAQRPKTHRAPQQKRERRGFRGSSVRRSIPLMNETPKPKPPRKKPYKVGDSVHTNHGEGTVVEVDGDKYLVDLEWQPAKLWMKGWGIKKV
jgi:F-box protein, helicase, 18